MATVLGLAMRVTADASGLAKSLTPVDRALQSLGQQADKSATLFDTFRGSTAGAAAAQEAVRTQFEQLTNSLREGGINAEQFAEQFAAIQESARQTASEFARGLQITEQSKTADERRAEQLAELNRLLELGAISQETFARAAAEASGANAAAAAAERERNAELAASQREAAAITEKYRTEAERRADAVAAIEAALQSGAISEATYQRAIEDVTGVTEAAAAAERQRQALVEEGLRVTRQFATAEESRATELARLQGLLDAGAISQETFARAAAEASGANAAAAVAERERAAAIAAANRIIEANLTPQERYDAQVQELRQHLDEGRISQETFDRALAKASASFEKAAAAAGDYDKAADGAGRGGALAFNELSGILSALPGPLGNVAGRLSGLSSASEGLGRVFAGGLTQGIQGIAGGITNLVSGINPAVAGLAAFAASSTAVARSLIALEGRVEQLGRLADQLGVSFEFVQTLEEAGRRADVSVQTLSGSFARLQNTLAGADEESKKATEALSRLGLSVQEFSALSQQEQIDLIGEKLASIENPAQRSAAAIALFGRSGVQLLPFFNELDQASADMERFGGAVSELDRQRLADFGAGLDALGVATRTLGQELTLPFTGLGEGIAKATAEIIGGFNSIVGPIGDVLEPILTQIGRVIEVIGTQLGGLGRLIGAVLRPLGDAFQAVSQALKPLNDFLVDLNRYIVDGIVEIAEWLAAFQPVGLIATAVSQLGEGFSQVGKVATRIATIITEAFSQFTEFFSAQTDGILSRVADVASGFAEWSGITAVLELVGDAFQSLYDNVGFILEAIGNAIESGLSLAEAWLGIERNSTAASDATEEATRQTVELTKEQQKAQDELNKAIGNSQATLDNIIEKSAEFGQAGFEAAKQFQEALAELEAQAAEGELDADQYARGVALATAEYERQIESVQRVAEETRRAADEVNRKLESDRAVADTLLEQARIAREFDGDAGRAQAAERVLAVEREITRVKQEVSAAVDAGDLDAVAAGQERIRQLETIKQQQADIADGTAKQREETQKLIEEDRQRVDALLRVNDEAARVEEDILAVRREQERLAASLAAGAGDTTAQQQRLSELEQLEARLEDQQQAIEQGFGEGFQAAFDAVTNDIDGLIDRAAEFGNEGAVAAQRLQDGIAAAQEQARAGILNAEAFEAEVQRQQQLFEGEIARIEEVEQFRQQMREEAVAAEQERLEAIAEAQREAEQQREQVRQAVLERERQFFEEQRKAAEAEAQRQEERIRALSTLGAQAVQAGDIRTAEGAALVQQLAADAQDPALIEQRRQTKLLQQVAAGITAAAANYFDSPVEIVQFARIGGIP